MRGTFLYNDCSFEKSKQIVVYNRRSRRIAIAWSCDTDNILRLWLMRLHNPGQLERGTEAAQRDSHYDELCTD